MSSIEQQAQTNARNCFVYYRGPSSVQEANLLLPMVTLVIYLDISNKAAIQRVCNRRLDPETGETVHLIHDAQRIKHRLQYLKCRLGDSQDLFTKRLARFEQIWTQLNPMYSSKLWCLDATMGPLAIHHLIKTKIHQMSLDQSQ